MTTTLYHATARENLDAIRSEGLRAGTFFGREEIADYYAETIRDEGKAVVILEISLSDLEGCDLAPDMPGIEEPLSYTLGASEEQIWEAWDGSDETWQASLELIGSVMAGRAIPAHLISFPDDSPEP